MGPTLLFSVLFYLLSFADAANILAFFPISLKSHQIFSQHLLMGLAAKGNKITYVTSAPMSEPHVNIKEIIVDDVFSPTSMKASGIDISQLRHSSRLKNMFFFWNMMNSFKTEILFENRAIKDFIRQKRKFDVILSEIFFYQQAFVGLGDVFDAPVIEINTNSGEYYYHDFLLNPNLYSYVPNMLSASSDRMTFHERLMSTLEGLFQKHVVLSYYYPNEERMLHSAFNISDSTYGKPSLNFLLRKNIAAAIINSDPVIGFPRPLMPHTIQVAGITVQKRKPLPQDLQQFLDEGESGVIYFSLGSILKWDNLVAKKECFVQAFARLPQRVLWKFPGDLGIESSNIMTRRWFPQGDILAHPNCRLFITHGGYLSLVDTVDAGVPIIGIPFFADQPHNVLLAEVKGFGIRLNFDDLTPNMIVDAIQEILSNKTYSSNAKKISALFNDRVVSPLEKAVHLVEFVARHKGHPGSETGAKDLWWFQYFLLDVAAIILAFVIVVSIITYKITRFALNLLCRRFIRIKERCPIIQEKFEKND